MTGTLPDRDRPEPLQTLRSVRRINPDEQATQQAVQRALAAIQRVEFEKPRYYKWRKLIMRSGIAAAILMVIAATCWLVLSGPAAVAAPTWADITRQTTGIDLVYCDAWVYKGHELKARGEIWIKSPGIIRQHTYELIDGKMVPTGGAIASPDAGIKWSEKTKLGTSSPPNELGMATNFATTLETVLGLSSCAGKPEANITINGEQVVFEPVNQKHPEDPTLRGFKLRMKTPTASAPSLCLQFFQSLVYWFAERSNTLCRLTMLMGEDDNKTIRYEMIVKFAPDIPAGWFDVTLPKGYYDVAAGVSPRLSPEVREVYEKVTAARKRFGDYRAVIWRDRTGGWPVFREAVRDKQWRCDGIDWPVMHSALSTGNNPNGYVRISPTDPFEKLWEQVNRKDYKITMIAMTWQGKFAVLLYGQQGTAQLCDALQDGYENFFAPSLFWFVAWPEWMWWENLQPSGVNLDQEPLQWRLGPADSRYPDRVEVIGECEKGSWRRASYTLDRSKDWLCVRQEWGDCIGHKLVWEIKEFGRTDDGFWYPLRATALGGDYDYTYAIDRSAAEPVFFDYPKGMPEPTDPFAQFMSQVMQTNTTDQQNLPETAKGKYKYMSSNSRGLARGFDNKEQSDAHAKMVLNMRIIWARLQEYALKRNKVVFPESLQVLVDEGYLKSEELVNPLHPNADPPFMYIRPNWDLPNSRERMVLYEPFDEWPGVVTVLFQDERCEHIHDREHFNKLLREATAPEPPGPWEGN